MGFPTSLINFGSCTEDGYGLSIRSGRGAQINVSFVSKGAGNCVVACLTHEPVPSIDTLQSLVAYQLIVASSFEIDGGRDFQITAFLCQKRTSFSLC